MSFLNFFFCGFSGGEVAVPAAPERLEPEAGRAEPRAGPDLRGEVQVLLRGKDGRQEGALRGPARGRKVTE